jgi:hypothetical protein
MPFNDSNKDKEKKDSQRTRSGDRVVFAHLATQGLNPGYDEIPKLRSLSPSGGGVKQRC